MTGTVFDHLENTLNEGDLVMFEGQPHQIQSIEKTGSSMAVRATIELVKLRLIRDITVVVENNKKVKNLYKLQSPSEKKQTPLESLEIKGEPS
jgi:hypothetical protein